MTGTKLRRACITGHPVAQSRSPMLHGYWLKTLGIDGAYERADVAPEDFPAFFRDLPGHGFVGGNITKPHKEAAFRLVDRREGAAAAIGAVNTVWFENGTLVLTADHGNVEQMYDPTTHGPHTAHTTNLVPVLCAGGPEGIKLHDGALSDVAPTLLKLMGLPQPGAMTGQPLYA